MAHSPLASLLRLRRLACDEAMRAVVSCVEAEAEAGTCAWEASLAIEREADAATALAGGDGLVEAFAAWLPGARLRAGQAGASHERRQAETACARAALAASRGAVESLETLIARRSAAAAEIAARLAQRELDDACRPATDP